MNDETVMQGNKCDSKQKKCNNSDSCRTDAVREPDVQQ